MADVDGIAKRTPLIGIEYKSVFSRFNEGDNRILESSLLTALETKHPKDVEGILGVINAAFKAEKVAVTGDNQTYLFDRVWEVVSQAFPLTEETNHDTIEAPTEASEGNEPD